MIRRLERDRERALEERQRARDEDPNRLEQEQRDYVLGITSLWMIVPAAQGLGGLDVAQLALALQTLGWQGNPYMLAASQFEAFRTATLMVCLLPTCTVSLASWRYPLWDTMADADRFGAKMFFMGARSGQPARRGPAPICSGCRLPGRHLLRLWCLDAQRRPRAARRPNVVARRLPLRRR